MDRFVHARHAAVVRAFQRAVAARSTLRLRTGSMWLVLGAGEWRGNPLVRHASVGSPGEIGDHAGRSAGLVCRPKETIAGSHTASGAAGPARRTGPAMRVLLQ